jgi:hypothetical protein
MHPAPRERAAEIDQLETFGSDANALVEFGLTSAVNPCVPVA